MIRASYKQAIQWIAENDNENQAVRFKLDQQIKKKSILLIAEIFQLDVYRVALDVIKYETKKEQIRVAHEQSILKSKKNPEMSEQQLA